MKRITIAGPVAFVQLTRGMVATIDTADADLIGRWKWHVKSNRRDCHGDKRKEAFYAIRTSRRGGHRKEIFMHSFIFGRIGKGLVVDHDDGDTLNNRRSNLKDITQGQNRRKSTATRAKVEKGIGKCVYFSKREQRYYAVLHLGSFVSQSEAESSFSRASSLVFGPIEKPDATAAPKPHCRERSRTP